MAMLCNYFEPVTIWYGFFVVLLIGVAAFHTNFIKTVFHHYILIIIGLLLLILSIIESINNEFLFTNIMNLMTPTLICISMSALVFIDKDRFKKLILSRVTLLNVWWVINLILVAIQVAGVPLFIKSSWMERNSFYQDLCCGLFGYNRTHELAFFSCMILVCNLHVYSVKKKKVFLIYTLLTEAAMLVCSYFNDNTAFFILLPLVLVMYFVLEDLKKKTGFIKRLARCLLYVLIVTIIIAILLQIPAIRQVYDDYIQVRINALIFYNKLGVAGSNERAAIVEYAFRQPETWRVGSGIAGDLLGEHMNHGFKHFGLSSMGIMLCLTGVWYYTVHTFLLSRLCNDLIVDEKKRGFDFIILIVFIFMICISFYSPIMTSVASMFWIALMFGFM